MIRDITIGQFFPGNTFIHSLDPRTKLICTLAYVISLFFVRNMWGFLPAFLFLAFVISVSKTSVRMVLKSVKPVVFIVVLTAVLNMFYTPGETLWSYGFLNITREGVIMAVTMPIRLILLVIGSSMLTYTTSPIMLTDAIENLLGPLKKFKIPVHDFSMMMTIALRFIPTLIEETDKIISAQKARGADFESGNIMRRAKAMVPILVPLFISAFRRADELAVAMECRCYNGGLSRTRLKKLEYGWRDFVGLIVIVVVIAALIGCNYINFGYRF